MVTSFKGRVWVFRDDVNTDEIIPARYLNVSDPQELAKHCMEDIDVEFARKLSAGDIIVGGKNFGCGSSREHAPLAIKAAGVSAVIARTFARIFYRNAINIGLPILECPEVVDAVREGEVLEVNTAMGTVRLAESGQEFTAEPFPPFMQDLIAAGGLMAYVKKRISDYKGAASSTRTDN